MIDALIAQLTKVSTFALIGLCLILIVEGLVYAVLPEQMKVLLNRVEKMPINVMRSGGILAAAIGGFILVFVLKFRF